MALRAVRHGCACAVHAAPVREVEDAALAAQPWLELNATEALVRAGGGVAAAAAVLGHATGKTAATVVGRWSELFGEVRHLTMTCHIRKLPFRNSK